MKLKVGDAAKVLLSRGRSALGVNVGDCAERSPRIPLALAGEYVKERLVG